jgi:hypothetical protein
MDAIAVEEVAEGIAKKYLQPDGAIKPQFKKDRQPPAGR